jgi:hypothetical protein
LWRPQKEQTTSLNASAVGRELRSGQVALAVAAQRRVVDAGLVAVSAAGEVVVLAEGAERTMTGARRVPVRDDETRLSCTRLAPPNG